MSLELNTMSVEQNLLALEDKMCDAMQKALFKTGTQILDAAQNNVPKPPVRTGDLRGSAAIRLANGDGIGPEKTTTDRNSSAQARIYEPDITGMDKYEVRISYNTNYAVYLHEDPGWTPRPSPYTEGDVGNIGYKWLERAIIENAAKITTMLAKFLKAELK